MRRAVLAAAVVFSIGAAARAAEPGLVVVLPLADAAKGGPRVDDTAKTLLEEAIRTVAGEHLSANGYTILTGENTLRVLADNGIDGQKACEASCALEAAREIKAQLFISGTVAFSEGYYTAFVRLFEAATGRQLSSTELEGKSVREVRKSFEGAAPKFFGRLLGGGGAPDRARAEEQRRFEEQQRADEQRRAEVLRRAEEQKRAAIEEERARRARAEEEARRSSDGERSRDAARAEEERRRESERAAREAEARQRSSGSYSSGSGSIFHARRPWTVRAGVKGIGLGGGSWSDVGLGVEYRLGILGFGAEYMSMRGLGAGVSGNSFVFGASLRTRPDGSAFYADATAGALVLSGSNGVNTASVTLSRTSFGIGYDWRPIDWLSVRAGVGVIVAELAAVSVNDESVSPAENPGDDPSGGSSGSSSEVGAVIDLQLGFAF